ncbi:MULTISPECIES: LytTR family DNA-binding domain-containing protein [unclassified Lysobacter]|uniref:LytR/AlgR family response regulator transcription factor n=1 Tax=unclassified Lysobacter TaxID=2635362 RepID=UPI001BEB8229|nr:MULTISPECIES: LytTR family DNA-binding domain-containing protein [unclassified Lysobacter]MBT2748754.1 response regulator transcription factor [Lysobacter sp. ISL-42]MBT2751689.1 response regulator transcription factor [Lysobacter sp. ISL-50]MBT2775883.1 response regulator transcription factor [Lysobacter sp. ISL-54]MBT2782153.1 response regulator transcription factor [Lysobacter sp. ISL-52]
MNGRIRAILADDEPMALMRLSRLLREEDGIEVVAECGDGTSALAALSAHCPDVAFLDIHMPGMDGLSVSASVVANGACVVFVTAHSEHAVHAFEADAVDYLLKPFTTRRLQAALARLRARLTARRPAFPERLSLQAGARLRSISVQTIDSLIASANYVEVHSGNERFLTRETLSAIETRLDPTQFVRIHRSRVIRIGAVRDMEVLPSGQYLLRLHNGQKLSGGRSYRDRLRKALGISGL